MKSSGNRGWAWPRCWGFSLPLRGPVVAGARHTTNAAGPHRARLRDWAFAPCHQRSRGGPLSAEKVITKAVQVLQEALVIASPKSVACYLCYFTQQMVPSPCSPDCVVHYFKKAE